MAGEWILAVSLGCLGNDASIKIYHPRAVKKDANWLSILALMMYNTAVTFECHQPSFVTNFITNFCIRWHVTCECNKISTSLEKLIVQYVPHKIQLQLTTLTQLDITCYDMLKTNILLKYKAYS